MRLVFGPDDHEGYLAARERLQSLVVAWARRRGIPVHPALVAAALDHRRGVDGRRGLPLRRLLPPNWCGRNRTWEDSSRSATILNCT